MNKKIYILLLCCANLSCKRTENALDTEQKKLGYVIGIDIGRRLKNQPFEFDFEALKSGMENYFFEREMLISPDSIRALALHFQKKSDAYEERIQKRRKDYLEFQDSLGSRAGVITLPSGLQYQVLAGEVGREKPLEGSLVKCHVKGYLPDGEILENSFGDSPRVLEVGKAIEGIKIVLKLMSPGMKIRTWIPSPLAFGRSKIGDAIPEYGLLIYEVELLEIARK